MVLTLLLIFAGIFMVFRVFQQYESLIIENEDRQLLGLARSVDRSITSYLQQISRDLLHTLQRDGMEEAEETCRRTGDPGALARQLEGTILTQHPLAYDVLCLEGESILYSARGKTDYTFPADAGLAGDVAIRPCLDADGTIYLSFVKETESRLQYAVLVELTAFYDTVAGNLIAGTQDRILLLDAGGRTVVYQTAEGVTAERIGSDAQAAIQQEELDALLGCRDGGEPMTLFYQARAAGGAKAYTARMAALPAEGNNGVFVVGASLNFETIKRPIQMSTIRLTAYSSMIVVGILLLTGSIVLATRRSARAQQEVLTLREQNLALEEVTKKTQALAHHQRLEIIGTLTSSIAHEFNNLLTPIMGYSIMVLEKLPPEDEETCDNVLEIYEASRKAKTIISRLSDLSRKNTALTFQYLSPDDLAQRALDIGAPAGLLISVGGNVCATGPKPESGQPWVVGIQNPAAPEEYLHTIHVENFSVVTSGDYQRYFTVDGVAYHHIIDPDTLYPADYWRSVTILCPDSGLADALSTALFTLPRQEGQALLDAFGAQAMWVQPDGSILYSPGFREYIRT